MPTKSALKLSRIAGTTPGFLYLTDPFSSLCMTSIERTAYPRFKHNPTAKELAELYTPTPDEVQFARSRVRSKSGVLSLMVMLKSFQRLGYFPHLEFVPVSIISHLRSCLNLRSWVAAIPSLRSRRYYQKAIRVVVLQKLIEVII